MHTKTKVIAGCWHREEEQCEKGFPPWQLSVFCEGRCFIWFHMSEINEDTATQHCLRNLATIPMILTLPSFNGNLKQAIYSIQFCMQNTEGKTNHNEHWIHNNETNNNNNNNNKKHCLTYLCWYLAMQKVLVLFAEVLGHLLPLLPFLYLFPSVTHIHG